jgi:4-hydroxy 2-oxovalerate aldolase
MNNIKLLDCTLRDGGYYNAWDFEYQLVDNYIKAMVALPVDVVELGFRNMPVNSNSFFGACAYTTDSFINTINCINRLDIAVMVNASDLLKYDGSLREAVEQLFNPAEQSPVDLVRLAVHVGQLKETLPAITYLNELGYKTTINLMQIAGLSKHVVSELAMMVSSCPVDILYFADSLGSMIQDDVNITVDALRQHWEGELGFHAHNNLELALYNALRAIEQGVTWIDGTVLGMGRGPGNAHTEYLALELEIIMNKKMNNTPLHKLIAKYFKPMQDQYGWGPNPFYYMASKYGIHPTYIQEMLSDSRYDEEDVIAAINHLRKTGGKKYNSDTLEAARNFYVGEPRGTWKPAEVMEGKAILILGTGPGVAKHRHALESYIREHKPYVIALNTQSEIDHELIDVRTACHPIRLLADCNEHILLPHPLVTPASMLPENVINSLQGKELLDCGIAIQKNTFKFEDNYCVVPTSIVIAYTLALATSGKAKKILMAGFDGFGSDDPRNLEMNNLLYEYQRLQAASPILAITPTQYKMPSKSIYAM